MEKLRKLRKIHFKIHFRKIHFRKIHFLKIHFQKIHFRKIHFKKNTLGGARDACASNDNWGPLSSTFHVERPETLVEWKFESMTIGWTYRQTYVHG